MKSDAESPRVGRAESVLSWPEDWRSPLDDGRWRSALSQAVASRDWAGLLELCEIWVGLEVHLRLDTGRKLFCAAPEGLAGWVDMGWPGALPSLDPKAPILAARLGSALGAKLGRRFGFERKRYAYPDLSKGYQTTQKAMCIWTGGVVRWAGGEMALERAQIEEDAARVKRGPSGFELDFARAGSPLLEVVSKPWKATPAQAAQAAKALWREAIHTGASQACIEEGHFKTDVNISLCPKGASLGLRVEAKGIGSFDFVEAASDDIAWMLAGELLGEAPRGQRTVGFDEQRGVCVGMRSKGDDAEYKFLPEGDIVLRDAPESEVHKGWMSTSEDWLLAMGGGKESELLLGDPRKTRVLASLSHSKRDGDGMAVGAAVRSFFAKYPRAAWESSPDGAGEALGWILGKASVGQSAVALEIAVQSSDKSFDAEFAEKEMYKRLGLALGGALAFEQAYEKVITSDTKAVMALEQVRGGKRKALGYVVGAMGTELRSRGVAFEARSLSSWLEERVAEGRSKG